MIWPKTMLATLVVMMTACGETDPADRADQKERKGHVWETQTDMIDKARDTQEMLDESASQRQQAIDELAR